MHRSGILILTHHVSSLCNGDIVKHIVAGVKDIVCSTLYVHVANTSPRLTTSKSNVLSESYISSLLSTDGNAIPNEAETKQFSSDVFLFLSKFYAEAASQCRDLDVNILLHSIGDVSNRPRHLQRPVQCIIADCSSKTLQTKTVDGVFQNFVKSFYQSEDLPSSLPLLSIPCDLVESMLSNKPQEGQAMSGHGNVVIGGTYDHIHVGHKVLLSEATLLADKRLLIGLTDGKMLERKTLSELIMPWQERNKQLSNFLCEIAPFQLKSDSVKIEKTNSNEKILEIVRILDPIGPASTDPDLQCIVVSKETERGGSIVNEARIKNGLNSLKVHLIGQGGLIGDEEGVAAPPNESKFSSSTIRYNSLGSLRRPPRTRTSSHPNNRAYVIGLTGGIASGKSSIARRLQDLGAVVIDCDKLGHEAYKPNTDAFRKVVNRFGDDIVGSSGEIDRKALARKVFTTDSKGNHSHLNDLNAFVWPEIERLSRVRIDQAVNDAKLKEGKKLVCVLDAAVLLEAKWDNFTDEVWVCVLPPAEAVKRIEERDGLSKEEAERRIQAQMSGHERVKRSHVALSSLWDPEVTKTQVQRAWTLLHERVLLDSKL